MKIFFSSVVFLLAFQYTFSQVENPTSGSVETLENELNNYQNKLSVIDNIIIRSNLNRFDNLRTSFQLRLMLNNYRIINTNKEKISITKELKINDFLLERNKNIRYHYEHIINYYKTTHEYDDLIKSVKNCKKADSLYTVYIASYQQIDYKDYIANKQTLVRLETKSNNYSFLLDSIKNHISSDTHFKNIDELNFKEIKRTIDSLKKSNHSNLNKDAQKLKIDLLESNINHQIAKKNQFVEGVIMSYNLRDDLIINDRFLIGLRLKLPWLDSTIKNKINELQFEKNTLEINQKIENENIDFELNRIYKEFEINYKNYETILHHHNDLSLNQTYDLIINSGKISIFEIIELEKFNQSIQKELNDYKIIVLKLYLEFLVLSGQLDHFKVIFKG
jgi:hypothetical protein